MARGKLGTPQRGHKSAMGETGAIINGLKRRRKNWWEQDTGWGEGE